VNATSAFPADRDRSAAAEATPAVPVWDAAVRLGHWLMVACFAGAWITAESERWRLLHVSFGYTLATVVGFRLLWGLVGTRPARFVSFVRGPRAVAAHVAGLLRGRAERVAGHNPLGGWAVLALLGTAAALTLSGWLLHHDLAGHTVEEAHEWLANGLMALVGVHLAAVLAMSLLGRENLVGAMLSGRKRVPAREAIPSRGGWIAAGVLLALAAGAAALPWVDVAPGATPAVVRADADD
jgi:cytochrome b